MLAKIWCGSATLSKLLGFHKALDAAKCHSVDLIQADVGKADVVLTVKQTWD